MKRMTKHMALATINTFGKEEEIRLIEEGKIHEAYQIDHARRQLLHALLDSIKAVREELIKMTEYTVDEDGIWHYSPLALQPFGFRP